MLPELIYGDLPTGVEPFYLSDYLANTVADNAVVNTTSFTPFRGAICGAVLLVSERSTASPLGMQ